MQGQEIHAFNAVIEGLYNSAADGRPWDVHQMRMFLGTDFCHILYMSGAGIILNGFSAGMSDSNRRDYLDHWAEHDEIGPILFAHTSGAAASNEALMSRAEFEGTAVFEGFYEPNGVIHFAVGYASVGDGLNCAISVQNDRRGGRIRRRTLEHINLLVPHLQCAMRVSQQMQALQEQAEAFDQLLLRWGLGLIRSDRQGHIHGIHGQTEQMLARCRSLLRCSGSRVELSDTGAERRLRALLENPLHGQPYAGPTVYIHDPRTGLGIELTVLPIPPDAQDMAQGDRLILLRDARRPAVVDRHYLRRRFHLTPTEADVLARLLLGETLTAIADARGSTLETIRSYLKELRKKLNCTNQAQLVSTGWRGIGFTPH